VTILINNAGIVNGKKLLDTSQAMMKKTLEVNTLAHLYTIKEFMPDMIKANKGHIVTVASMAAHSAIAAMSDYCASKSGAYAIDESIRMEISKNGWNIQTTCICPYYINTGMFEGVSSPIIPILDKNWVTWRIITGMLQNESQVYLPWILGYVFLLRGFLPVALCDMSTKMLGINNSMDDFKGSKSAKKTPQKMEEARL
jgi:short-subunit dehydrogenase